MATATHPRGPLASIISQSKVDPKDNKTFIVPDSLWPQVIKFFQMPPDSTLVIPFQPPYQGFTFAQQSGYKSVGPGVTPGLDVATGAVTAGGFTSIADAITSTLDFMKFIAWIFHPRNILRAVEFLVGITLMVFGLQAAMQARGERIEGFSTSEGILTRSGLGRVATELGHATRSRERPQRPRSAPHRTRQRALSQRYRREEDLQRRRSKNPRPKRRP